MTITDKNEHFHYDNFGDKHSCACIACSIDRWEYEKKDRYEKHPLLRCKKQEDELDLFLKENKPKPWITRLKNYISSWWWKPKEKIEVS